MLSRRFDHLDQFRLSVNVGLGEGKVGVSQEPKLFRFDLCWRLLPCP